MSDRRRASADQTGSMSASVPLLVLTILVLVGFVFDGGNAITAHRRAVNLAEQAARAGAQHLDIGALRSRGQFRLDRPALACSAAAASPAPAVAAPTTATAWRRRRAVDPTRKATAATRPQRRVPSSAHRAARPGGAQRRHPGPAVAPGRLAAAAQPAVSG